MQYIFLSSEEAKVKALWDLMAFHMKRRHNLNSRDRNANTRSGGRTCISAIATGECAVCMHTNLPVGVREAASFIL
jgi:hypothetical protein